MLNFEEREELRGEGREKKWGRMRKVAFGSVLNPNRVTSDGLGVQSNKGYVEVEVTRKSGGKKTKEKMKRTPPLYSKNFIPTPTEICEMSYIKVSKAFN